MGAERAMVVGYLETSEGEDSVALGRRLAAAFDMRPVVTVVLPFTGAWLGESAYDELLRERLAEPVERARRSFEPIEAESRFELASSPALGLRRAAASTQAGLMVIGSTHHCAIGHALMGSTGDSLLTDLPCAIAVAPTGLATDTRTKIRHVGVAFDGSPESYSALSAGIQVAQRTRARLTLVTVMEFARYGYAIGWTALPTADYRDLERESKQEILDRGLERVPPHVAAGSELLSGSVGDALSEVSGDFDLLLAGSRGYGPIRRTVAGSSTHKLLRAAGCPVLLTPRGAGTDPLRLNEEDPDAIPVDVRQEVLSA
ncbi:universal stress protein [Thermoleophilia bacterium SCSIO 60948]|nr:universal stress protein [Thermoleophilia bacterium SCSIO 60948]